MNKRPAKSTACSSRTGDRPLVVGSLANSVSYVAYFSSITSICVPSHLDSSAPMGVLQSESSSNLRLGSRHRGSARLFTAAGVDLVVCRSDIARDSKPIRVHRLDHKLLDCCEAPLHGKYRVTVMIVRL